MTPKKLQQMKYAADTWTQLNAWVGDGRLQAAEVSGPTFSDIRIAELDNACAL